MSLDDLFNIFKKKGIRDTYEILTKFKNYKNNIYTFTPLRFSEVHIWVYSFTLAFFFLIIIPLIIMGFIAAFYYHYFPSLTEWKDKRNVKRMTYRFIAECPYGTFKDPYERTKAFAGFIQDQDKAGDLLE